MRSRPRGVGVLGHASVQRDSSAPTLTHCRGWLAREPERAKQRLIRQERHDASSAEGAPMPEIA